MNWVLEDTTKLRFHTNLEILLVPIAKQLRELKWIASDLDINSDRLEVLPIGHDKGLYHLSAKEMDYCRQLHPQIVWGYFVGIYRNTEWDLEGKKVPHIEGNQSIWSSDSRQIQGSVIEIICYDSSLTIVKFSSPQLSHHWKSLFIEAVDLDSWSSKNLTS